MTILEFFEEVKDNMSNRDSMVLNQQFLTRANDAIKITLGRALSMKLITFLEEGDISRTTGLGFNVLKHPKLENDTESRVILEDLLIIAVKNHICARYEPMLSKTYMANFWEAIGSHKEAIAMSREMEEIGSEVPRAFP